MPSGRTNNFPESGRGLGHVTPTIFGSTVGYPSDSLASCSVRCYERGYDVEVIYLSVCLSPVRLSVCDDGGIPRMPSFDFFNIIIHEY